ncbi:MAG: DUF3575 domain-containing protein [Bacteroidetes bacterium]|nr:DUF3575 domain-containing protein [Bacteroidota bacterium]
MRKLVLLLSVLSLLTFKDVQSQNIALGMHVGFAASVPNVSLNIPVGINAEWAYDSRHSFAGRAHYSIRAGSGNIGLFYISPEYKFHITGESLDGFYVGSYMGFGGGSGAGYLSVGAVTGYSLVFKDNWSFEANLQAGYGLFTNMNRSVFHILPTVGIRYAF